MAIAAAASIGATLTAPGSAQPPSGSAVAAPAQTVWLDQNWDEPARADYHHASQGTLTLPFPADWILQVERPKGGGLFIDPAYLETFGFIPSPPGPANPDGLPIGLARTTGRDPGNDHPFDRLGFTCAGCHTGRLDHGGTRILVDGGPAMLNLNDFGESLARAIALTLKPSRFGPFAIRVLGPHSSKLERLALYGRVTKALLKEGIDLAQDKIASALSSRPGDVREGPGRLDALNRIGNTVFGGMHPRNVSALTAPVAYPHIWDTHWFSWVQYNGSIEQPMVRNAGEAMGVGAAVNFDDRPTPRFTSTIPFRGVDQRIEQRLRGPRAPRQADGFSGLRSPRWPEAILGQINRPLADEGARLYQARCQHCHMPAPNTDAFWTDPRWTAPNSAGERYINLEMVNIDPNPTNSARCCVGTDPAQARDMAIRTVWVPLTLGVTRGFQRRVGRYGVYSYGFALGDVVALTVGRGYNAENVPQADRARMDGNRPNGIRAEMQYKARPLNGVWATPPFLHNGAIRTIWDLLSPYRERPCSFRTGSREYDVADLGYASSGSFQLVSVLCTKVNDILTLTPGSQPVPGNMNVGHLFDRPDEYNLGRGIIGSPLSERERRALIEYLKTL